MGPNPRAKYQCKESVVEKLTLTHSRCLYLHRVLVPTGRAVSEQQLAALLADAEAEGLPEGFDPVAEAFRAFDPRSTGFAEPELVREALRGVFGGGMVDDTDLAVALGRAGVGVDGRLSLEAFRTMLGGKDESGQDAAAGGERQQTGSHDQDSQR